MDEADQASASTDFHIDRAIQNLRDAGADLVSNLYCVDCGIEIPEGRRLHAPGCIRCVACQFLAERVGL